MRAGEGVVALTYAGPHLWPSMSISMLMSGSSMASQGNRVASMALEGKKKRKKAIVNKRETKERETGCLTMKE